MSNAKLLSPWKRSLRRVLGALVILVVLSLAGLVADEVHSSRQQADWLAGRAGRLNFELLPGPSPAIRYAGNGPYDQRLGYHQLPDYLGRLKSQGFEILSLIHI